MRRAIGWGVFVATGVAYLVLATRAYALPFNGCQTCLAQGYSWWWCFAIYGSGCL